MNKKINNNWHPYVDLDLPSGTLWAMMNVGARKLSDCGLYFQWGGIKGYTKEQIELDDGKKKFKYDFSDYKFSIDESNTNFSKYTTKCETLDLEDDAAHVYMGGDWHMPTPEQIQELIDNTTTTWTTQDGVNGRLFTSKKDPSKSIFIPAAGDAWDGSVRGSRDFGNVWSSMLNTNYVYYGQLLYFDSGNAFLYSYYRYDGFSVRGVVGGQNDTPKNNKHTTDMNLVEILKNAPIGTKLWSYACGTCYFKGIVEYSDHPIECKAQNKYGGIQTLCFTKEGKRDTIFPDGQCVLFPSEDNQDWGAFKAQKVKYFEPFQKVLHIDNNNYNKNVWKADLYSHYNKEEDRYYLASGFIARYDEVIPYKGNEDKLGKEVE